MCVQSVCVQSVCVCAERVCDFDAVYLSREHEQMNEDKSLGWTVASRGPGSRLPPATQARSTEPGLSRPDLPLPSRALEGLCSSEDDGYRTERL